MSNYSLLDSQHFPPDSNTFTFTYEHVFDTSFHIQVQVREQEIAGICYYTRADYQPGYKIDEDTSARMLYMFEGTRFCLPKKRWNEIKKQAEEILLLDSVQENKVGVDLADYSLSVNGRYRIVNSFSKVQFEQLKNYLQKLLVRPFYELREEGYLYRKAEESKQRR